MAAEDYHDMSQIVDFEYHVQYLGSQAPKEIIMAAKKTPKVTLIKVGNQLIEPSDVACITKVRTRAEDDNGVKHSLYIVRLKSNPNPEYPIWVRGEAAMAKLLQHFNIEE